jgi:hypothetical protein
MRNARLADWILALVTTEDRAAATVGDLMEQSRGAAWFCASVLGTSLSIAWTEVKTQTGKMALIAVVGFLLQHLASVAVALTSVRAMAAWTRWHHSGLPAWFFYTGYINSFLIAFLAGWLGARCAPRRELPASLAMIAFGLTFMMIVVMTAVVIAQPHSLEVLSVLVPRSVLLGASITVLSTFAGAIWARHRQTVIL